MRRDISRAMVEFPREINGACSPALIRVGDWVHPAGMIRRAIALAALLALSAGAAVTSLFLGAPVLSSAVVQFDIPVLGHIKLVTALFFDLGVYLIVVGLVLDVLRSLGARIDEEMVGLR